MQTKVPPFPTNQLLAILDTTELSEADAKLWTIAVQPLKKLVHDYAEGLEIHAQLIVVSLLQEYLSVEQIFQVNTILLHMFRKY